MLPPGKGMVLNVEYTVSPVTVPTASGVQTTLVGYMDYTVVVSTPRFTRESCRSPCHGLIPMRCRVLSEQPWSNGASTPKRFCARLLRRRSKSPGCKNTGLPSPNYCPTICICEEVEVRPCLNLLIL